ncbi:hypothetical protein SPHINGO391_70007 [Sphingomonas aurantiaca]|uniref:Uncharacterized protein n=1 Tax=Sphingomonas aurantiaca TaxID=185949 RepID=A0A5E8AMF5_9SPHN|nr:hypothetical protein SPHINGO391_70007 [Sphingomonas aurantiaca]
MKLLISGGSTILFLIAIYLIQTKAKYIVSRARSQRRRGKSVRLIHDQITTQNWTVGGLDKLKSRPDSDY